jgi:hypothetical protein
VFSSRLLCKKYVSNRSNFLEKAGREEWIGWPS